MVYISLVRDFLGYYVEFEYNESIPDRAALGVFMNKHFRPWWCSVYPELPDDPFTTPKVITLDQLESRIAASDGLYEYTQMRNILFEKTGYDHLEHFITEYEKTKEDLLSQ